MAESDVPAAGGRPHEAAAAGVRPEPVRAGAAEAEAAQLRAIFETMTDGLIVLDPDGRVLRANAAAREMLAIAGLQEQLGRPLAQRSPLGHVADAAGLPLPQEGWPLFRGLRGEVLTGEHAVEVRYARADGREVLLNVSVAPLRDGGGEIVGVVGVLRDVTALRRLEARSADALDALLAMAEVLVEAPTEAGAAVSPPAPAPADPSAARESEAPAGSRPPRDAAAQRLVQLTQRLLGCERLWIVAVDVAARRQTPVAVVGLPEEQVGAWWGETGRTPFADAPRFPVTARLEAGEVLAIDLRRPPFSEPPFAEGPNPYGVISALVAPMRIRGRLIGVLAYDYGPVEHEFGPRELALAGAVAKLAALVLERERLTQERAAAQADALALREVNRRMDEFVGIVAHELRTPLTTVVASIQTVARQLRQAEARGVDATPPEDLRALFARLLPALARSGRQAARLTRLVEDLLDLSRIQSGRLALRREVVALAPIVRDVVEEQQHVRPDRAIALAIPADLDGVTVDADADRIAQVLTNYLTNALKYSAADQPVEVTLRREGEGIRVAVRNHGAGIARTEQGHVWDRFYRGGEPQAGGGSGPGMGLGLYISRTIIERHGGGVGLRSAPGKGSTFWFTLPMAARATG